MLHKKYQKIKNLLRVLYGSKIAQQRLSSWESICRDNQIIPKCNWYIWLILAGRGWGKTRTGSETIKQLLSQDKVKQLALVGRTMMEVRKVMVEGESGILAVCESSFRPKYYPSRRLILFNNGSRAYTYSSESPDQLRGPQHDFAWGDELASWNYVNTVWHNLILGLRLGERPRVLITTTPKQISLLFDLVAQADQQKIYLTQGSTYDNDKNLPSGFLDYLRTKYTGTNLAKQEIEAQLLDYSNSALWTIQAIDRYRVDCIPLLNYTIIAVDPAMTSDQGSETGIIVIGTNDFKQAYVLEDLSGFFTVTQWTKVLYQAYKKWKIDLVVCEVNQGGDLVQHNLQASYPEIPFKSVRATRGKIVRAEPIATLYAHGRIHHVGYLHKLEEQMVYCTPDNVGKVDRLDALVWGLTQIFFEKNNKSNPAIRLL